MKNLFSLVFLLLTFTVKVTASAEEYSEPPCVSNFWFEKPFYSDANSYTHYNPINSTEIYVKVTPEKYQDIDYMELYVNDQYVRKESSFPYEWCRPNQQGDSHLRNLQSGNYELRVKVKDKCGQYYEKTLNVGISNLDNPETVSLEDVFNDGNSCEWEFDFEEPGYCSNTFYGRYNATFGGSEILPGSDIYVKVTPRHYQDIEWVDLYVNGDKKRRENSYPYEWCKPNQPGDNYLRNMPSGTYYLKVGVQDKCGQYHEKECSLIIGGNGNGIDSGNNGNSTNCQSQCQFESLGLHGVDIGSLPNDFTPNRGLDYPLGNELYVKVNPENERDIDYMDLYVDNQFIRRESQYPYEWCLPNQNNDNYLRNLPLGTHPLRVEIKDRCGSTSDMTTEIHVENLPDGFLRDAECIGGLCWLQQVANIHYDLELTRVAQTIVVSPGTDLYVKVNSYRYQDIDYLELTANGQYIGKESTYPFEWCKPNQNNHNYLRNVQSGTYNLEVNILDICGNSGKIEVIVHVSNNGAPSTNGNDSNGNNGNTGDCQSNCWFESLGLHGVDITSVGFNPNEGISLPLGNEFYVKVSPENAQDIDYMDLYVDDQLIRRENQYPYEWCRPNQSNDEYLRNLPQGTYTLQEIIDFLIANDVSGEPDRRQYGIVRLIDNGAQSAAFSGDPVTDFIGHITGGNYAIQGNGLLSEEIIQDMETRFLEAAGDLACRLMAALQGANVVGADTRCVANGTSSLFALIKVAQPGDEFGSPSFLLSTRTEDGDGVEPIDVVQGLFDEEKSCVTTSTDDVANFDLHFSVFPNPASEFLRIEQEKSGNYQVELLDIFGNLIKTSEMTEDFDLALSFLPQGTYLVRLSNKEKTYITKIVKL